MRSIFFVVLIILFGKDIYATSDSELLNSVSDSQELDALEDLYNSTNGANWTNKYGWPSDWSQVNSVNDLRGSMTSTIERNLNMSSNYMTLGIHRITQLSGCYKRFIEYT